ncbi:MAG: hypothetical protein ACFFBD_16375, partial [Candidatus Hodarchaeota archaeon]
EIFGLVDDLIDHDAVSTSPPILHRLVQAPRKFSIYVCLLLICEKNVQNSSPSPRFPLMLFRFSRGTIQMLKKR